MRFQFWHSVPAALSAVALAAGAVVSASAEDASKTASDAEAEAVFAGGCFWCVEADFDKVEGVKKTISGFAGGHVDDPSYKQVVRGGTGHYEAVKIVYDPSKVSYSELVEYFWRTVDPTDAGGQFCDRGESYLTAIFATPDQRAAAEASKAALEASGVLEKPVVTPILDADTFWPAERYHQNYYKKNKLQYNYYRRACGRDRKLEQIWADAPPADS